MSARLLVDAAGPGVTIQDEGRFGLSRYGVTPAGPMDLGAYLAATRAAGADSAIEVSLGGVTLRAEGATLCVAVAGGDFDIRLDGRPMPPACLLPLAEGARLVLRAGAVRGLVLCRRRRNARPSRPRWVRARRTPGPASGQSRSPPATP